MKSTNGSLPHVLVISLKTNVARRSFQKIQLDRLDLPFQILEAVSPADIPSDTIQHRSRYWGRPLRATEVACLLSHRMAWQYAAKQQTPTLILEDDAILAEDAVSVIAELVGRTNLSFVTLETFKRPKRLGKATYQIEGTGYTLSRLYHDRGGAAAYLVWPDAARHLLAYTKIFSPLADSALTLAPGFDRHQVEPAVAIQAMFLEQTKRHIEAGQASAGPRPKYASYRHWLRAKWYRLAVSGRLGWNKLRCLRVSEERLVEFNTANAVRAHFHLGSVRD